MTSHEKTADDYLDAYLQFDKFLSTEANRTLCDPYKLECLELTKKLKSLGNIQTQYRDASDLIVRKEYATESNMHRGYFCPSPVVEYLVGGLKRGRLLKNPTENAQYAYMYGFDQKNRLRIVERNTGQKELLIYEDNNVYFIEFTKSGVETVGLCQYDIQGRILYYCYGLYQPFQKAVNTLTIEKFLYCNEQLISDEHIQFLLDSKKPILSKYLATFHYDQNSTLESYDVIDYDAEKDCYGSCNSRRSFSLMHK